MTQDVLSEEDMIWIATWAFSRSYDYVDVDYSDYMYGHEDQMEDVREYVEEIGEIGTLAFKEKYKQYKMYF